MLDVGGQRSERRKWIHCFQNVTSVLFCVAMSEYDQVLREDPTQNRMIESLTLFDEICNSDWFKRSTIILFLNKTDLFQEKIAKIDLNVCFKNYTGGLNYENASSFVKARFVEKNISQRPLYTHFTCALSTTQIEFVFRAVKDVLLRKLLEEVMLY